MSWWNWRKGHDGNAIRSAANSRRGERGLLREAPEDKSAKARWEVWRKDARHCVHTRTQEFLWKDEKEESANKSNPTQEYRCNERRWWRGEIVKGAEMEVAGLFEGWRQQKTKQLSLGAQRVKRKRVKTRRNTKFLWARRNQGEALLKRKKRRLNWVVRWPAVKAGSRSSKVWCAGLWPRCEREWSESVVEDKWKEWEVSVIREYRVRWKPRKWEN